MGRPAAMNANSESLAAWLADHDDHVDVFHMPISLTARQMVA